MMPQIITWAFVVAVNDYFDRDAFPALKGALGDGLDFTRWVNSESGGNANLVRTLPKFLKELADRPTEEPVVAFRFNTTDPHASWTAPDQANPSAAQIEAELKNLHDLAVANLPRVEGRVRRLFIYCAGHGFASNFGDIGEDRLPAFLTADATGATNSHVLLWNYARAFYNAGIFDQVFIFIDCCQHSVNADKRRLKLDLQTDQNGLSERRFIPIVAAPPSGSALEFEKNGKVSGLFTQALLAGLSGDACAADNTISALGLRNYLYNNIHAFLPDELYELSNSVSNPVCDWKPDGLPESEFDQLQIVKITGPRPLFTVQIFVPPQYRSATLRILDIRPSGDQSQAEITAPPDCWELQLPRKMYVVHVVDNGFEQPFEVTGAPKPVEVRLNG
jgi:hypothetical protein